MNAFKNMAALTFSAFILAGCASKPVVIDKGVPEPERATLYLVGSDFSIEKVDDKPIKGAFGIFAADTKGTGGGTFKKKLKPTVQIPPGTRKIQVDVSANCGTLNPLAGLGGNACKPTVTHDFESGKKYKIKYVLEGTETKLLASEITGEIPEE